MRGATWQKDARHKFRQKKPAVSEPAASSTAPAASSRSSASALLSKRPHLGSSQLKYQYEVQVHSITFTGPVVPQGAVKVLWTRGSKQAETADGFVGGGRSVEFGSQRLSLLCTLFRDAKREGPTPFADKLCSFFLLGSTSRGAKPLGKCEVNISPFADVLAAAPTSLEPWCRAPSVKRCCAPLREDSAILVVFDAFEDRVNINRHVHDNSQLYDLSDRLDFTLHEC